VSLNTERVVIHKGSYTGGGKISVSDKRGFTDEFLVALDAMIKLCLCQDPVFVVVTYCYNVFPGSYCEEAIIGDWDRKGDVSINFEIIRRGGCRNMYYCCNVMVRNYIGDIKLKIVREVSGERREVVLLGLLKDGVVYLFELLG
jgi:hypothetical protein